MNFVKSSIISALAACTSAAFAGGMHFVVGADLGPANQVTVNGPSTFTVNVTYVGMSNQGKCVAQVTNVSEVGADSNTSFGGVSRTTNTGITSFSGVSGAPAQPLGINNYNETIGVSRTNLVCNGGICTGGDVRLPFFKTANSVWSLPFIPNGLNDYGVCVGDLNGFGRIWAPGQGSGPVAPAGSVSCSPYAVNNNGHVCGQYRAIVNGPLLPFYLKGSIYVLPGLPNGYSQAVLRMMNDWGVVAGIAIQGGISYPMIWNASNGYRFLQRPNNTNLVSVHDINNAGFLVGQASNTAALWSYDTYINLNSITSGLQAGEELKDATAISDANHILCSAGPIGANATRWVMLDRTN